MGNNIDADIVVIGAGIVGMATSIECKKQFPNRSVVLLERNLAHGMEASTRNSGVLHSGFHHSSGSLKEQLANKGSKLALEFALREGVPVRRFGMLIVAPLWVSPRQGVDYLRSLLRLWHNGRKQNIPYFFVGPSGIRRLESNVQGSAGVFLPDVYVVDSKSFIDRLYIETELCGVISYEYREVIGFTRLSNRWCIHTNREDFYARCVINTAGLHADEVAAMAGFTGYRHIPVRGEYYKVCKKKQNIVTHLVYPVVPPGNPQKGIHASPRPDGSLYFGPSAKVVAVKSDYYSNKTPPEEFVRAIHSFIPDISVADLTWGYSGIRAKLDFKDEDEDFVIMLACSDPPFVCNFGMDSPGFSSAIGGIDRENVRLLTPFLI